MIFWLADLRLKNQAYERLSRTSCFLTDIRKSKIQHEN
jgi:hypothetical protein